MGLFIYQVIVIVILFFSFFGFVDVYLPLFNGNMAIAALFSYISLILTFTLVPAFIHRIIRLFISNTGSSDAMSQRDQFLWGINSAIFDTSFWVVTKLLPVGVFPHVIYRLYGLKCGKGVAIFARLWDVDLIEIGDHSIIGTGSITTAHVMLADGRVYRNKIKIGHHSSIGLNSIVLPGVTIGNYCIIAPGSVVAKNAVLDSYSLYSGNPAVKVKDLRERYGLSTSKSETTESN